MHLTSYRAQFQWTQAKQKYIIVQESTILKTKHALITCSIVTAESLGQLKIRFRSGSKSSLTANIP
jgi:hypothetical protein